jgi:hypothetical protein
MNGHARPVLGKTRARRDAAKMLGTALQTRYRRLLEASGEDEIVVATGDLAQVMYENVEFVIWALKLVGGLNPPPPGQLRKITPPKQAVKDSCLEIPDNCTCPPLEHGILFRDRHMTSCPKYIP